MYSRRRELAYRRMISYLIDETTQDIGKPLLQRTKIKSFDKFSRCVAAKKATRAANVDGVIWVYILQHDVTNAL